MYKKKLFKKKIDLDRFYSKPTEYHSNKLSSPTHIILSSIYIIHLGIKQALMDRRRQLEFSIYPYESHTRKIVSKLMEMKELANSYLIHLKQMETYRWTFSVGMLLNV